MVWFETGLLRLSIVLDPKFGLKLRFERKVWFWTLVSDQSLVSLHVLHY